MYNRGMASTCRPKQKGKGRTMTREQKLTNLANILMLTAKQAIALPATVSTAAAKVGKTEEWMIDECFANRPLANYLAQICRQVTA